MVTRSLLVKLTAGAEAAERCAQGLTVAAMGVASGAPVALWLTGEAVWLAVPGRAAQVELAESAPFDQLIEAVLAGGRITVCSQCAARRGLAETDLLAGIDIAGAAVFVEAALVAGTQALVY